MGKWIHRLTNIDPIARTADCAGCGPVAVIRKNTNRGHGWRCQSADGLWRTPKHVRKARGWFPDAYTRWKGPVCERCGFVPEDRCQLDVNHKDGVHTNNDPSNLETLCANCHRLITKLNGHGPYSRMPR